MDGIFGIGFPELVMIVVIALIVLGPERLPGTIREVAKFIKQIRAIGNELMTQFGGEFKELQDLDPRRILNEMTDPNKPDVPSKTPATKPAQNTVSATSSAKTTTPTTPKPATATTASNTTSAAKSLAASAAVASSEKATNEDHKTETNANSTPPVKSANEAVKEKKEIEPSSSNGNTIAPPVSQSVSVSSSAASLQNGNGQPAELVESKPQPVAEAIREEEPPSAVQATDNSTAESKPKRTRKPRSKAKAENAEQAEEQSEGAIPHEPTN